MTSARVIDGDRRTKKKKKKKKKKKRKEKESFLQSLRKLP